MPKLEHREEIPKEQTPGLDRWRRAVTAAKRLSISMLGGLLILFVIVVLLWDGHLARVVAKILLFAAMVDVVIVAALLFILKSEAYLK